MRTSADTSTSLRRTALVVAVVGMLTGALAGCQPEPSATEPTGATPSGTPTAGSSKPDATPDATPEASPSASAPAQDIALPASCDDIYSSSMRGVLEANVAPMNDPGVTMPSTQNADALALLESGVPTLRCTWGYPSERGIATSVAIVDPAAESELVAALSGSGFACGDAQGGTLCRFNETLLSYDDKLVEKGETHFFRDNGWVSTVWLDYGPEGYTEDIAAMIWG
ncbi:MULTISPECIES: hypothetical protein [unclassified Microbacterium]|uniref:hypothetical protein n=1 Tax=unclassified Microbacterium TaxID=2609290 RepID=UPI00214C7AB4|nr:MULTISPECIES: hypothetical protein [unclassified Microbacterium]MCR2801536.1 hypothetical protein [Microbacterium sp. zg.Y818]MCR2827304.1 hypothetical protein [Microbacterium sp. zg.Y909]WIM23186.1 hypothetical protein QNO21_03880 [Microbacterium sp. zg-Y818]